MKKKTLLFKCSDCSREESRWLGRCPQCGGWNTYKEIQVNQNKSAKGIETAEVFSLPLESISPAESNRISSGMSELDRVLGGGLMKSASILVGGEPGIGKSTLLLQTACKSEVQGRVLYVSGEESAGQIRLRSDRLGLKRVGLEVLCTGNLDRILNAIDTLKPNLLIVDSVQTLYSEEAGTVPGTVNQMKYSVYEISEVCKERGIIVFFVAHVTKEGIISGPKTIEHMVDTVLYFEQTDSNIRFLRSTKNRFGSTDEVGIFSMQEMGLIEITDPNKLFLVRRDGAAPAGSVTTPVYEGSRILLVEVQALCVPAKAGLSRVYSERVDSSRVARLAAVLEKNTGLRFSDQDIYVNVAGGIKLTEPGIDLAVAIALYSARIGIALNPHTAISGEVSLAGEIRHVNRFNKRVKTAKNMGYIHVIGPKKIDEEPNEEQWLEVSTIQQAVNYLFKK